MYIHVCVNICIYTHMYIYRKQKFTRQQKRRITALLQHKMVTIYISSSCPDTKTKLIKRHAKLTDFYFFFEAGKKDFFKLIKK